MPRRPKAPSPYPDTDVQSETSSRVSDLQRMLDEIALRHEYRGSDRDSVSELLDEYSVAEDPTEGDSDNRSKNHDRGDPTKFDRLRAQCVLSGRLDVLASDPGTGRVAWIAHIGLLSDTDLCLFRHESPPPPPPLLACSYSTSHRPALPPPRLAYCIPLGSSTRLQFRRNPFQHDISRHLLVLTSMCTDAAYTFLCPPHPGAFSSAGDTTRLWYAALTNSIHYARAKQRTSDIDEAAGVVRFSSTLSCTTDLSSLESSSIISSPPPLSPLINTPPPSQKQSRAQHFIMPHPESVTQAATILTQTNRISPPVLKPSRLENLLVSNPSNPPVRISDQHMATLIHTETRLVTAKNTMSPERPTAPSPVASNTFSTASTLQDSTLTPPPPSAILKRSKTFLERMVQRNERSTPSPSIQCACGERSAVKSRVPALVERSKSQVAAYLERRGVRRGGDWEYATVRMNKEAEVVELKDGSCRSKRKNALARLKDAWLGKAKWSNKSVTAAI